ncbi:MAG: EAL domain-containing protein [Candidatus Thiodiazotropha sp. 6PLUC1]
MKSFLQWRLSLRSKMLLTSILVEIIMLALLVGNSVRLIETSMERLTESRIKAIELAYKTSVAVPLASRDYATLRDILDGWRKADDVLYLVVTDINGRFLATSGWDQEISLPPPGRDPQGRKITHVRFNVDLFDQNYGQVQYGLSIEYIHQAKQALFTQGMLIALAGITLTVILLSIIGYWLTRHMAALMDASGRVANGDYEIRLKLEGKDEIAQLGKSFNLMADAIQNRILALRESDLRSRTIADYTYGWENWLAADGHLRWVNPAVNRVTGYTQLECYTMPDFPLPIIFSDDLSLVERCHRLGMQGKTGQDQEFRIKRKDGRVVWVAMSWQPIADKKGNSLGYRSSIRDISLEHHAREALEYQANHDDLTGLFNRRAFEVGLQKILDDLRTGGQAKCLLYIDLDQFKLVNDTCGHSAGDKLLQEITAIMRQSMSNGFLARLGGDEFGLILEGDEEQAYRQATKLIDAIHAHQYSYEGHHFQLGASVGMVNITDALRNIDELLIAADQACYAAKDRGRNRIEIYRDNDEYFRAQRAQFLSVEEINNALREQRFVLYYQRIVPLQKGLPEHAEILLRMRDNQGQILTPDRFIPAAERFNLMPEIDRWVISNTCRHLKEIKGGQFQDTCFAINLSGLSLSSDDLAEFVISQFDEYQIDPKCISFEITETATMDRLDKAKYFIRMMRNLGVKVALDDFGTGLSSFAYLRELEVDFLKIDALFVRNLDSDERDLAVVRSIMEVAKVHGMQTIAEFVHNMAISKILEEVGVDYAQGFALHKPEQLS